MEKRIKIVIAEDHSLLRDTLISFLAHFEHIEVLWGVENGKELLGKLKSSTPDIILLDIDMPIMNGHEALTIIRRDYSNIKVIMLSMHYEYSLVIEFIRMGASSFLPKNCQIDQLLEAINMVYSTGKYHDAEVSKMLENSEKSKTQLFEKENPEKVTLTDREIKIIELLRSNKTNREIADQLFISLRTLERNRADLMQKTGCNNLASLLAYAIEQELIQAKPLRFHEIFFTRIRNKLKRKVA